MKRILIILLAVALFSPLQQSCDFKPVNDLNLDCPDSLQISFIVKGDTASFTSRLTYPGNSSDLKYVWQFGDDSPPSNEPNPTHIYEDGFGDYTVSLAVTTDFCDQITDNALVGIGTAPPVADFTPKAKTILVGDNVTFENQTTGITSSFTWWVNGIQVGSGSNLSRTFNEPDTAAVWLIACGPGGCDTAYGEIVVRPITFSRDYDFDDVGNTSEKIVGLISLGNGGYGILMNNGSACYIAKADNFGNQTEKLGPIVLGSGYTVEPSNFVRVPDGYLLIGSAKLASNDNDIFVFKLNAAFGYVGFKTLQEPFAGLNEQETGFGAAIASDNVNYLICGNALNSAAQGIYLATVENNSNFAVLDRNYFFNPDNQVEARYIIRNPSNNGYWVAGKLKNPSTGQYEASFFRFSDPFVMGTRVYMGTGWTAQKILLLNNNQDCLVIGNGNGTARAAVVKGSNTFQPWSFAGKKFNDAIVIDNNRVALAGTIDNGGTEQAAFFQLNIQTGALQTVPIPFKEGSLGEVALVISATPDGGFAMGGYLYDNSVQKALLVKTDRNGVVDQ